MSVIAERQHRPVSYLLWLANSDAPRWRETAKYSFYGLKDKILSGRAVDDGVDWQRITYKCWGCHGTGVFTHYSGTRAMCRRCYGSGIHSTRYVQLHRLRFGGRVFHSPGESQFTSPETDREIIDGRIRHGRKGWRAVVAFVVLLILFDRQKLWKLTRLHSLDRSQWLWRKVARWCPVRCVECKCWLLRKDAGSTLIGGMGKRLGVLCKRCSEDVPF